MTNQLTLETRTHTHCFQTFDIGTPFKNVSAVYVFSRRNLNGSHQIIYVGQTKGLADRFANHHRASCIKSHGANKVSILQIGEESTRLRIEAELINRYNPICNQT